MTNHLAVQRLYFDAELYDPLRLDFYSGSMLRGMFGHALKRVVCVTRLEQCTDCLLVKACVYPHVFEGRSQAHSLQNFSDIPKPYVIEPPPLGVTYYQAGETLSFSMVLIGSALRHVAYVIAAWERALAWGLGKERAHGKLTSVMIETAEGEKIPYYQDGTLHWHDLIYDAIRPSMPCREETQGLCIKFETPVGIKKYGKILQDEIGARDFLMPLLRRYFLLEEFYGDAFCKPDFAAFDAQIAGIHCESRLTECAWQRYSNRQQQKMTFGGVLGELRLSGKFSRSLLDILFLGQWFHVGSKAPFGMGKYKLSLFNRQAN